MSNYTTVLFDLDHTLLDSEASAHAAFEVTMRSVDIEATPTVFATYNRLNDALWRRVEAGELSPNAVKVDRFEQLLRELGADGDPVAMGATFIQVLTEHGDLYAGALDLLEDLHGTVRLAMVTNGIGTVQRGRLDRLGITSYFETVSVSGELGVSKPGREIFDHTFEQLKVTDLSGVVMIGDSLASDIAGANNVGIDSIWFNQRGATVGDSAPTHIATELGEISDLI